MLKKAAPVTETVSPDVRTTFEDVSQIWLQYVKTNTPEIVKGKTCRSRAVLDFDSKYPPMKAQTSNAVLKQWYFIDDRALSESFQILGTRISEWWRSLPCIFIFGQPIILTIVLGMRLFSSRLNKKILIPALLATSGVFSVVAGGTGVEPRYIYSAAFLL